MACTHSFCPLYFWELFGAEFLRAVFCAPLSACPVCFLLIFFWFVRKVCYLQGCPVFGVLLYSFRGWEWGNCYWSWHTCAQTLIGTATSYDLNQWKVKDKKKLKSYKNPCPRPIAWPAWNLAIRHRLAAPPPSCCHRLRRRS